MKAPALPPVPPPQRLMRMALITAALSLTLGILYTLLARSTEAWQWPVLTIWALTAASAATLLAINLQRHRSALSSRGLQIIWWTGILIHSALLANLGVFLAAAGILATVLTWVTPVPPTRHSIRALLAFSSLAFATIVLDWVAPLSYRVTLSDSAATLSTLGVPLMILAGAVFVLARFRSYNIWTKMLIALLLVALLPAWILAFVSDHTIRSALMADAQLALSAAAQQTAAQVDVFVDTNLDDIRTESQLPAFARFLRLPPDQPQDDGAHAEVVDILRAFTRRSPDIRSYGLLDVNGRNVVDTDVQAQGGDESAKDYYQTPFSERLPYVSPIHIDQATGNAYIYFSSLVHGPSGEPVGVLRVRYSANVLQQIILQNNDILGRGSFSMLVDENHVILADGLAPERILRPVVPLDPARTLELQKADRLLARAHTGSAPDLAAFEQGLAHADTHPFFTAATNINGSNSGDLQQIAVVRLATRPWLVAFGEPQTIFTSLLTVQTRSEFLLGMAILIGVAASATWLAKRLADPIVNLTGVANRVAAGDQMPRVSIETGDEIGQLAAAFQTMVGAVETREAQLTARAAELELLNELGRGIASTLNLREIAQRVVTLVALRFNDYLAGLLLYDQERAELVAYASAGQGAHLITLGARLSLDVGLIGRAAQTSQTQLANQTALDPQFRPHPGLEVQAEVVVPILGEGKLLGVLVVGSATPNAFQPGDVLLLETLAAQLAPAIENARLFSETEHRMQHLHALREIDQAISNSLDLKLTLDVVLKQVVDQLRVDAADILLLSPGRHTLTYAAGLGFRSQALQHTKLRLGDGLAGRAALEGRLVSVPDLSEGANGLRRAPLLESEGFSAYYGVPLLAKGQVKGVLEVFHRCAVEADSEWLEFLEALAGQAAIAVDNAELFEGLQQSNLELARAYDKTLEGWTRALDLRDEETEGHTQRVTEMTVRLATYMGLGEAELVHVRRGALLHDIGKMGIPDSILLKPGPLTEVEWEIMRKHPVYAHDLLLPITHLRPALDIPYCHHEKWDGTGYPQGLKGELIPFAARIFAVVDVWDALRSDRPYRAAWSEEKVNEYIREQSGKHFEPKVVEAFLRLDDHAED